MTSEKRSARRQRIINAVRKTPPAALASPDTYSPVEVAAMLREIGVALSEVAQPTPIVHGRLRQIAAKRLHHLRLQGGAGHGALGAEV